MSAPFRHNLGNPGSPGRPRAPSNSKLLLRSGLRSALLRPTSLQLLLSGRAQQPSMGDASELLTGYTGPHSPGSERPTVHGLRCLSSVSPPSSLRLAHQRPAPISIRSRKSLGYQLQRVLRRRSGVDDH
ncbi:hypothetical protein NDU88_000693 [Pleurodeles waltl]|uniref:Uncharacterized protein n=1 Tax=Pleurodeles waltl TaxID=8319 RepID=A0AAV7NCP3_PLEWA|nr:hypothetical protein NDU88_000693 [Pleurodeles waltl]